MMKQSFIWTILLGLSTVFFSCEKTDAIPEDAAGMEDLTLLAIFDADEAERDNSRTSKPGSLKQIRPSELPALVHRFIAARFEGATILRAGKAENGAYVVQLKHADDTLEILHFDAAGNFLPRRAPAPVTDRWTPLAPREMPETVRAYLATNFRGAAIVGVAKDNEGKVKVEVKNADGQLVTLLFDVRGNLLAKRESETVKNDRGSERWVQCSPRELSERVRAYVARKYPEATVERAAKDAAGSFRIVIKTSDGKFVGLAFDAAGNLRNEVVMQQRR